MREGAHRARDFADAHLFGGGGEAGAMARKLVPPQCGFQAKRDGLGVHAVGAADFDGVAMLESQFPQSGREIVETALRSRSEAFLICRAWAVSTTSFEVRP